MRLTTFWGVSRTRSYIPPKDGAWQCYCTRRKREHGFGWLLNIGMIRLDWILKSGLWRVFSPKNKNKLIKKEWVLTPEWSIHTAWLSSPLGLYFTLGMISNDPRVKKKNKIKLIPGHMVNLKYMTSKVQKSQHSLPASPGLVAVFGGLKLTWSILTPNHS